MDRSPQVRRWPKAAATLVALFVVTASVSLTGARTHLVRPVEVLGASGLGSGAGLVAETGAGVPVPVVARSLRNDTSSRLEAIDPSPPREARAGEAEGERAGMSEPELPGRHLARAVDGMPDGALQTSVPAGSTPSPLLSFKGLTNTDNAVNTGYTFVPPDVTGDAGGGYYVEAVNGTLAAFDALTGVREFGPVGIHTLWAGFGGKCQTHLDGDPIVVFDELAGRWLVSQFALSFPDDFHECIAISKTDDPTGQWYRYDFPYQHASAFNDYPKFGVWPDGYYMSANQFDGDDLGWAGAGATVFERSKMLNGQPARQVYLNLSGLPLSSMLPADVDGLEQPAAGAPGVFAQIDDDAWGYANDQLELWAFDVDWSTPSASTFTRTVKVPVANFSSAVCGSGPCIDQPGTGQHLDDLAERLMNRLQYRNFGTYESLVTSHAVAVGGGRAGMRWYQLIDGGSGWSVADQGTYAPSGTESRWMGSAAMDAAGNLAVGYSVSGPGTFPSVRYAGREAGDPAGTLRTETVAVDGGGAQTGGERWGDYSSLSVAPDGCTFWYAQEYYDVTSANGWKTRVASFRFPSCEVDEGPGPVVVTGPTMDDAFQTAPAFDLSWSIEGSAATLAYDVRYRRATATGDFGLPVTWLEATDATGASFSGALGSTYCFSARAMDGGPPYGAWGPEACTSIPLNDTSLTPVGRWSHKLAPEAFEGDYSQTSRKGARLTKENLEAKTIALMATTCPTCGTVTILWNGSALDRFRLTSPTTTTSVLVPVATFNSVRTGTLKVKVSTAGKPVKIEGLGVGRL